MHLGRRFGFIRIGTGVTYYKGPSRPGRYRTGTSADPLRTLALDIRCVPKKIATGNDLGSPGAPCILLIDFSN